MTNLDLLIPYKWLIPSGVRSCWLVIAVAMGGVIGGTATIHAQITRSHKLLDSRMAPGILSQQKLVGNARLAGHTQAVRVIAPDSSQVSVLANGDAVETNQSRVTVGMKAGLLYRFRVDFVEIETPRTVYPSIELLDRLYPPKGLESRFPVPVVITEDDLAQASGGKLVTKVIYLEKGDSTVPRQPVETAQPYFDVSGAEDPLHVADSLGRPMAILRIGSRIPTAGELSGPSAFNSARPVVLPAPVEPAPMDSLSRSAQSSKTLWRSERSAARINLSDTPR